MSCDLFADKTRFHDKNYACEVVLSQPKFATDLQYLKPSQFFLRCSKLMISHRGGNIFKHSVISSLIKLIILPIYKNIPETISC